MDQNKIARACKAFLQDSGQARSSRTLTSCLDHPQSIRMEPVNSFADQRLRWLNGPVAVGASPTGDLGADGSFTIEGDGAQLTMRAPAKKDFWSKTFYTPLLIKSDASALLCSVSDEQEVTVKIDFTFNPVSQFDQAGLLVYIDDDHWMKCGIEYCDGSPRLSVVVCNEFSDWSTQPWPATAVSLKVHKVRQSDSVVVEAAPTGTENYQFVRIAHISVDANPTKTRLPWRVGPFAACPIEQNGCEVRFTNFSVGPREVSVHSSEL
jgi:regulation of enolase protein 1 (concanavalin A-like superfamily)